MKKINTLLLVDDDDIFQFLTRKIVEETNRVEQVNILSNGKEAIDFLKSSTKNKFHIPDIILLDLSMPIMDGWDFLKEYRLIKTSLNKRIVIYIVSSSNNPADIERANAISDVTDYIIKPITKEVFTKLLDRIV